MMSSSILGCLTTSNKSLRPILNAARVRNTLNGDDCGLTATSGPKVRRSDIREGGYDWFQRDQERKFISYKLVGPFLMKEAKMDPPPCIVSIW